jgi:heterodisulfide reductase subunit C
MEQLVLGKREKRKLAGEFPDLCLTCGTTGVDGMDMRKAVRMALLGLDQELIDSRFPWICTLCARCEHGCPMGIDLMKMMRSAR